MADEPAKDQGAPAEADAPAAVEPPAAAITQEITRRKTPTYVDAVRSATPGSSGVVGHGPVAPAGSVTVTGVTTMSGTLPEVSRHATPGGGAPAPRHATPGSSPVPHSGPVSASASGPAPRLEAQPTSMVTVMGSTASGPGSRHSTPAAGAERSFTPSGEVRDDVPEELAQRGSGSARTRIGLPSVTPGMFKRRDPDGDRGATATPPRGRETVLLTAVKRNSTPQASPAAAPAQPTSMPGLRRHATPADPAPQRARQRKVRPVAAPAHMKPVKMNVTPDPRVLVVLDPKRAPQGAAIRSLRHRLAEKGDPRVILISSADRGEGKTFCAANLALALAEIRRSRVLLIEANLHHPGLAQLFSLRRPPSLFGQLEHHRQDSAAPWQVAELSTHDMHLLAIDSSTEHTRSIDGPLVASCLDSLRGAYDYIIIDGPAVSAGPDVSLLEDAVDGILFVARTDQSRAQGLRNALDQISPQDLLGVVLLEV